MKRNSYTRFFPFSLRRSLHNKHMKARQVFDNHDLFGLVTFRETIISDISRILIFKMFVGAHIYELIRRHVTKKKLLHRFLFPFLGNNHCFSKRRFVIDFCLKGTSFGSSPAWLLLHVVSFA